MSRLARSLLLALSLLGVFASAAPAATGGKFPRSFLWGTAVAGFQTEMGGTPANRDQRSDWWTWSHDRENIAAKQSAATCPRRAPATGGAGARTSIWRRGG